MTFKNKLFQFGALFFVISTAAQAASDSLKILSLPNPRSSNQNLNTRVSPLAQLQSPDAGNNGAGQIRAGKLAASAVANSPQADSDDEILRLLRQSDQAFAGEAIELPAMDEDAEGELTGYLSLGQVLELALNNSYSFAATAAQADQARYARNAALGQLGPTIDVRTQRGREYSAPASVIDPVTQQAQLANQHNRWDASIVLRQPLFAPGSYFDWQKQRSLSASADFRVDEARESLYYSTVKAYYDLLRAYTTRSFARSYAERMGTLQDYMRKRLEGGGASKIDFERVRGRALTAQSTVAEAEGTLDSAMVTLAQLIGKRAQKMEIPARMMPQVPDTSRAAMEGVYENNPGIRAARQDVAAASQELKSARSRFSPAFSLELSQAKASGAGGDSTLTTDRRLMLVLSMNLLNGGSDYFYQKEIGAKYVEKSNTASDLERKLKEQIDINYRTLSAVRKRIDIARQAYETNANVADVFLEQLSTGSKQLLDVLDAYQQAYQSRMDFALLLFQQADISYQILRNTGRSWAATDDKPRSNR
ncbi:TolC family protein [Herbaspirillum autotrophicum]|uniref:TolC family protein n=1 Tax=Herbaspirillum autotrophicum TaxID=180195 RepID=UPI0009FAAE50